MEAEAGVTAIEVRTGELTVRVALLLVIPEREAEILDVPAATPVAKPPEAMVAALVLLLAQVTELVMIWLEPSS
jgi:hypothetical protein